MKRPPTAAGSFYPDDPDELRDQVDALLDRAGRGPVTGLRGLVAPHAGYA